MKRFLPLLAGMFLMAGVNAQPCTPNLIYTTPGIYPDTMTNLPGANVGVSYTGVITAVIPTDTTVGGYAAVIDSIGITDVLGLPTGFTWAGNTANAYIHGGDSGCIAIVGTPTSGQEGTYTLLIKVLAQGSVMGFPVPGGLPDTIRGYKIVISGPIGFVENESYSFGVKDMYPNPAADQATVVVTNNDAATITVNITDMIGRSVATSSHKIIAGENTLALNVANLNEGVYFYTVTKGSQSVTRKLIISR